ncbi:hypothetical protein JLK41_13255 [Ectopseudomonas khazarica]|uniref:hypothetical protein n=1 Tax=Ectopseudomonas khazarica TaxID=2502979 RepID=UPI001AEF4E2E|nr:hypothetical protein [Pseudomonas khazarica]QTS84316.1 hypothetical protein JLK41_13255 [Pseudomonas khazarica]
MHKPTHKQPVKNSDKTEGQAQKPANASPVQPFYKADRDPVISKDSFEGPAKSPQQPKEAANQTKPQATQDKRNAQNQEPKKS